MIFFFFSFNEVDSKRVYSEGNRCFFPPSLPLFIYLLVCIYSSIPAGLAPASSSPVVFCHVFSTLCTVGPLKWSVGLIGGPHFSAQPHVLPAKHLWTDLETNIRDAIFFFFPFEIIKKKKE